MKKSLQFAGIFLTIGFINMNTLRKYLCFNPCAAAGCNGLGKTGVYET
jgi:hypothetical protein